MEIEPFDSSIETTMPYKLTDTQKRVEKDPNSLYNAFSFNEILGDIHGDSDKLTMLYVSDRVPASGGENELYPAPQNLSYPDLYNDNEFQYIGDEELRLDRVDLRSEVKEFLTTVDDRAQVSLVQHLEGLPLAKRLFLIMGGIGCGKTTFLHHLFQTTLRSLKSIQNGKDYQMIYCNYRSLPPPSLIEPSSDPLSLSSLAEPIRSQLVEKFPEYTSDKEIERIIETESSDFRGVYNYLKRHTQGGLQGELIEKRHYAEKLLNNLIFSAAIIRDLHERTSNRIVIALDNMDQHSANDQLSILRCAKALLNRCPKLTVIVCIREYSLRIIWEELRTMRVHAMHMTTPPIDKVLKKRFRLLKSKYDRSRPPSVQLAENIEVEVKSYKKFLNKLSEVILQRKTLRGLYALTNADLRELLRQVQAYLESPHLPVERILPDFYNSSAYDRGKFGKPWKKIPFDCFLTNIIVKKHDHYCEQAPLVGEYPIINIFCDPDAREPTWSLLRYRLLDYFQRQKRVSKREVVEIFKILEPEEYRLEKRLENFLKDDFIESPEGREISKVQEIFATRRAWYYINRLSTYLVYLDLIRNDMWIDYKVTPPDPSTYTNQKLPEVISLIDFIRRKEIAEKAGASKQDMDTYKLIIGFQPISWRLLGSVASRLMALLRNKELRVTEDLEKSVNKMYQLQECIKGDVDERLLLPEIPAKFMTDDCWGLLPRIQEETGKR